MLSMATPISVCSPSCSVTTDTASASIPAFKTGIPSGQRLNGSCSCPPNITAPVPKAFTALASLLSVLSARCVRITTKSTPFACSVFKSLSTTFKGSSNTTLSYFLNVPRLFSWSTVSSVQYPRNPIVLPISFTSTTSWDKVLKLHEPSGFFGKCMFDERTLIDPESSFSRFLSAIIGTSNSWLPRQACVNPTAFIACTICAPLSKFDSGAGERKSP
mmetsp:Transcript_11707/g.28841  ORF Transcript_11707/g.28841 Transcript_11707/m.28841 type:complete len:217 (+) Transcript_11707:974-1624(+)